ncbi:ThiF family adenylyltransferase [Georgenia subflava]|uniref:Thiamine biosynthesis protein ThiF n=1 Tax=Georgenia subflava TaxID=1622177 RepID=A0A6N7EMH0_9MICO|nr:ThiF family adenylyltransferase [Georgenia subflava]MPV38328.1 thiamine biosynthesis protein ThiF [Georgenia subflava]
MRLRPGLSVLWRRKGESQVGIDPRCAVVLEDLEVAEQQVLDHLRHEPTEADLLRVGKVAGVGPERVRELVTLLERSGVVDLKAPARRTPIPSAVPSEVAYWSRLMHDGDGGAVLAARERATVTVVGLDQVGMRLATHLAEAGVGTLLLEDDSAVGPDDVGPYHPRDIGARRAAQAETQLRSTFPRLRTSAPARTRPDVLVAISWAVADPVRLRPLLREDVVHLPVVIGEVDVCVGPLVVPGKGPCTRCMDLHRTDADPAWPALATQLRGSPAPGTSATAAQLGAAVAAHQVLAALDGRELVIDRASLEVSGLSPLPVLRPWTVHPECGCDGVGRDGIDDSRDAGGRNGAARADGASSERDSVDGGSSARDSTDAGTSERNSTDAGRSERNGTEAGPHVQDGDDVGDADRVKPAVEAVLRSA